MHYYRFHIGDYAKDTSHLSPIEDIAYRRLLDWYYLNEKPIDPSVIARLIRMGEYATVVNDILLEFFDQDENGFVSQRADSEIIAFRQYGESKRNAALKRWESTSNADAMHVHSSSNAINHKPITNNQEETIMSGKPDVLPIKLVNGAATEAAKRVLDFLNQKTGRAYRAVPANLGIIISRLKEGATEQDCKSVIARKVRQWATDEKMNQYLRPETLFGARKFAQYTGELVETPDAYMP